MKKTLVIILAMLLFVLPVFAEENNLKISIDEETKTVLINGKKLVKQYPVGSIIKVEKNTEEGFFWPYYLYIPKNLEDDKSYIFVEPNNQPIKNVSYSETLESAYGTIMNNIYYSESLGMPTIVPVFPGTNDISKQTPEYYHAINRSALLDEAEEFKRVDIQLLKMVEDARNKLSSDSIQTHEKIIINGFSDSGNYVNRFTGIHPDKVKVMIAGGINVFFFPIEKFDGVDFNYPLGFGDYKELLGKTFDKNAYDKVAKLIYRGTVDKTDPIYGSNYMDQNVTKIIVDHLGKDILKRLDVSEKIYNKNTENLQFVLYDGIAHSITSEIKEDIIEFIKLNIDDDFSYIEASDHTSKLKFLKNFKSAYYLGSRAETEYAIEKLGVNGSGTGAMNAKAQIIEDSDIIFYAYRASDNAPNLLMNLFSDLFLDDKEAYVNSKYEGGKLYILIKSNSDKDSKGLIDTIKIEDLLLD